MFELNGSYSDVQKTKTKTANRSRFWLPKVGTLDETIEERCRGRVVHCKTLKRTGSAIAEQSLGRASANIWTLSKHFSPGERPLNSRVNCFYGARRKLAFLESC